MWLIIMDHITNQQQINDWSSNNCCKEIVSLRFPRSTRGIKKKTSVNAKQMLFVCCGVFLFVGLLLLVYFLLGVDCMLFLIFHVATHSSRVPTSGSQTGDTLGKALASVSVKDVAVGNPTHVLNQCWYHVTICTSLKHWSRGACASMVSTSN